LSKNYFIWPKSASFKALISVYHFPSVRLIESLLQEMFPSGYPVLCSSGRSALTLALISSEASRSDLVGVFPYAGHCVLDAISRITTPLAGPTAINAVLRIVYHQWGYVQEKRLPQNTIEDCVDTLCVPGAKLFPGGGLFEIWSLPKIIGVTSGGVLWCKDENTAVQLRNLRDSRPGGLCQWLLRLLTLYVKRAYLYWHAEECNGGNVSLFQTGEILMAIRKWPHFVSKRISYINKVWPFAVDGLLKPVDRLPSVVPISVITSKLATEATMAGIISGYRMFEFVDDVGNRKIHKVLPIPIHQDVSGRWINQVVNELTI